MFIIIVYPYCEPCYLPQNPGRDMSMSCLGVYMYVVVCRNMHTRTRWHMLSAQISGTSMIMLCLGVYVYIMIVYVTCIPLL